MSNDDAIKVVVRIRPYDVSITHPFCPVTPAREQAAKGPFQPATPFKVPLPSSREADYFLVDDKTLTANETKNNNKFTFDHVVTKSATQSEVFDIVGRPIVDVFLEGYNATVFAYGQTGAGKTYTMQGAADEALDSATRGLIPRLIEYLYDQIAFVSANEGSNVQFKVECSFLEIYNEEVFDLLDWNSNRKLEVRERGETVYVEGLKRDEIDSPDAAHNALTKGWSNRRVASTDMNRDSSRSHSLFVLYLETKKLREDGVVNVRTSKLNLIDLAGSERQKDTNAAGQRIKEASSINRSLSTIGNVINALVDISRGKPRRHVPYRDSKLSFLLRDSLGGNTKTFIVGCVHPGFKCAGESLSTLRFLSNAKQIKNRATINEDVEGDLESLRAEIRTLKEKIRKHESGSIVPPIMPRQPNNDATADSMAKAKDWKREFIEAMTFRERLSDRNRELLDQINAYKQDLKRQENMKFTHKMILRFRDDRIAKLVSTGGSEDAQELLEMRLQEIKLLNKELEDANNIESGIIRDLRHRLNEPKMQEKFALNARAFKELESAFHKLRQTEEILTSEDSNLTQENRELKEAIEKLRERLSQSEESDREWREKKRDLEDLLEQKRIECEDLRNAVDRTKLRAKIQMETREKEHVLTIQSMTPPSVRVRRVFKPDGICSNLDASFSRVAAEGDVEVDVGESNSATRLTKENISNSAEQEELLQTQGKRIEELTKQIQDLDDKRSEMVEKENSWLIERSRLVESKENLLEEKKNMETENERLRIDMMNGIDSMTKKLKLKEDELQFAVSELNDIKIMEAQALRRVAEISTEHDTEIHAKESQMVYLEEKMLRIEDEMKALSEELDRERTVSSELRSEVQRLRDHLDVALATEEKNEALIVSLQTSEDAARQSETRLSALLARESERCVALTEDALRRGEESGRRLVEVEEEKRLLQSRLAEAAAEASTLRDRLSEAVRVGNEAESGRADTERRREDILLVLRDVESKRDKLLEDKEAAEKELKKLEEVVETLTAKSQSYCVETEEAKITVETLREKLNEAKKSADAERQTYDWRLENLNDDNSYLNEMFLKLKEELNVSLAESKTARDALRKAEADLARLKAELEENRRWLRPKEERQDDDVLKENEALRNRLTELMRHLELVDGEREAENIRRNGVQSKLDSLKSELSLERKKNEEAEAERRRERIEWDSQRTAAICDKEETLSLVSTLKQERDRWKEQYEAAQLENGRLMGHQNHKQRIAHLIQLKEKLIAAQTEIRNLTQENKKLQKTLYSQQGNKENQQVLL